MIEDAFRTLYDTLHAYGVGFVVGFCSVLVLYLIGTIGDNKKDE